MALIFTFYWELAIYEFSLRNSSNGLGLLSIFDYRSICWCWWGDWL